MPEPSPRRPEDAARESPTTSPASALHRLAAHVWTIAPTFRHMAIRREPAPPSTPWHAQVVDEQAGPITISGQLHRTPGARTAIVIVHGMGGSPESYYCRRTASVADRIGIASLRLALRGADRSGSADYPHGGLTSDIHAAVGSPELAGYERINVLGFSLGGHASLRFASETVDPRVAAVATVCPPIDLAAACRHLDRPANYLYRHYLLSGLKEIYALVAERRSVPLPIRDARRIRSCWEWDDRIVAPRWGFRDAADYYDQASAMRCLDALRVPVLVVPGARDPMVAAHTVRPHLSVPHDNLQVAWAEQGGHVGFPPDIDLGLGFEGELWDQVVRWLAEKTGDA